MQQNQQWTLNPIQAIILTAAPPTKRKNIRKYIFPTNTLIYKHTYTNKWESFNAKATGIFVFRLQPKKFTDNELMYKYIHICTNAINR